MVVFLPHRIEILSLPVVGIQTVHKGRFCRITALQQAVYIIVHVVRADFGIDISYLLGKTGIGQDVLNQVVLYRVTVVALTQHDYIRFLEQLEYVFFGRQPFSAAHVRNASREGVCAFNVMVVKAQKTKSNKYLIL